MKILFAVTLTSLYALCIRLMFGFFGDYMAIMSISFLMITPLVIGFLTIHFIPILKVKNRTAAFFIPWLTSLCLLVITMLFNIEGFICWVMVFPLFAVLTGFGGILAFNRKRKKNGNPDELEQKINNSLNVSMAFLIPIVLGVAEGERMLMPETITIEQEIEIAANTSEAWEQILYIDNDKKTTENGWFSTFLGFPRHVSSILDYKAKGGKRIAYYEKGLYFEEIIKEFVTEKRLVLEINTDPESIPATVMDEHILIGGKYFDVLEDRYELEKKVNGSTKLKLYSTYYVNTPFNWYSKVWVKYIMSEILETELKKIKGRTTPSVLVE